MNFNNHLNLRGRHAQFSPSNYHWINYDMEKLYSVLESQSRKELGTELHDFASTQVNLKHKFSSIKELKSSFETYIYQKYYDDDKFDISYYGLKILKTYNKLLDKMVFETVKAFINDAYGFGMASELPLEPIINDDTAFGTTDAICFSDKFLRIHDLKTGNTPGKIEQLEIYAAYFCMEYKVNPYDIQIELRIYQNGDVLFHNPDPKDIDAIMHITADFVKEYHNFSDQIMK